MKYHTQRMNNVTSLYMRCQKGKTKASEIHHDAQQHNQPHERNSAPLNELTSRVRFPQYYKACDSISSQPL